MHDVVHIYGGSKGHLTYVPLSSFDPLFLFHHTMTDRLVAMWQVLNPTAWIVPMPAGETSFTTSKGTMQAADSPLTPFFSSENGTFWDSNMARSTDAFGYAYADTYSLPGSDPDLRRDLVRKINIWYGSASPLGLLAKGGLAEFSTRPLIDDDTAAEAKVKSPFAPNIRYDAKIPSRSRILDGDYYNEWVCDIQVNVEALDGSFVVHVFVGEPPGSETAWHQAPNLVGSFAIFAMNRSTGSSSMISGTVPLTSALMKMVAANELGNLLPRKVQPFLVKFLRFTVQSADGSRISPESVEGLRISVSSSTVQAPKTRMELPRWGPMVTRLKVWG